VEEDTMGGDGWPETQRDSLVKIVRRPRENLKRVDPILAVSSVDRALDILGGPLPDEGRLEFEARWVQTACAICDASSVLCNFVKGHFPVWISGRYRLRRDDAEDVASDVYEKVLRHLGRHLSQSGEPISDGRLCSWMFIAAKQAMVNQYRASTHQKRVQDRIVTTRSSLGWRSDRDQAVALALLESDLYAAGFNADEVGLAISHARDDSYRDFVRDNWADQIADTDPQQRDESTRRLENRARQQWLRLRSDGRWSGLTAV
jgi:DNA-directed RNA polymerase specialized sigma24 family protein